MSKELLTTLLDLDSALNSPQKLIIGGGYGLFLKQLHIQINPQIRTLFTLDALPIARTTEDIDLILRAEIVTDSESMKPIRVVLDQLGFTVVKTAKFTQFERIMSPGKVKIDLLAAPLGEFASRVPRDARRVKPRPSVKLHASKLEEALAVDRYAIPIPIQGQLSSGAPHQTTVLIPQAFTYLLMKLCAYRDRMDDADKNLGQHHALDIYRIVGLLTQDEDADVRSLSAEFANHSVATEAKYFARPLAKSYERPYGWSWLLKLAEDLASWDDAQGREWAANLKPLADVIARQYVEYFPKQTYPNRSGVHSSTAFGLMFALDYARTIGDSRLESLVIERATTYFAKDENVPAAWEPDGADFFSPSLMEADLMRRVLPRGEFRQWFAKFLPDLADEKPANLLHPAIVTDRTDPQLVHLDGLNLSRAWCMLEIAAVYPPDDPIRASLLQAAQRHAAAALPHITSGDYAGEHWLASFATYLLTSK